MTKRKQRMVAVVALLVGLGVAATLGFTAIRKNMMYFYTPSDIAQQHPSADARIRLGGMVVDGSLKRGEGLEMAFAVADCTHSLAVRYTGILPDLFREGQGIVATGHVDAQGVFTADEVLAKHDENYMPPELASALEPKEGGHSCAEFKSVISSL